MTMLRVALVDGGIVTNVTTVADIHLDEMRDAWLTQHSAVVVLADTDNVGIDDRYDGVAFTKPQDTRTLAEVKQAKYAEIDARTREIIDMGYEWPIGSGIRLSTNLTSQIRASDLDRKADSLPAAFWPLAWNSIDDSAKAILTGPADAHEMHDVGFQYVANAVLSGTTLKDQVRAATTIAEVEAVTDLR